jgi:chromosome segregation ATPase
LLGENTKKEKAINNLRHRGNYFENLILETKVQINELKKDQGEYEKKKEYLREELKDKEDIIEKIEKELVLYLRNTEDMKTIKNNHEFELNEYEHEVTPIQDDFKRIEENVKHMNLEIMKEYNHKVEKGEDIGGKHALIAALKQQKKNLTIKKLEEEGKFRRLTEKLTDLARHTFDIDLKQELKAMLDSSDRDTHLMRQDEEKERMKKEGEKLLRYKNMVRKEI